MSVECDGAGNTSSFSSWRSSHAGASASDQCSGVNWSDNYSAANWVADCGNTKHITVVFTATDACSNSSTTSAVFSIKDNTAPTINTQASNMSVECDGAGNTSSFSSWRSSHAGASASDQCSGVNWSDNYSAANWVADCGNTKHITVVFTATDACSNSSTTSAVFSIKDNTAPTINTQASNMSVECDGAGNTSSFSSWRSSHAGASASDQCSGVNWSDNYSAANWVADCGNTKHITVVFTATDACSNSSTTSAVFSIKDNTAPTINTQASNMSVECDGAGNTSSFSSWRSSHAGASASDQCSGVNWSDNYSAANWVADCGNTKHITVVFTATDACSNSSTTSAVFSIKDNTAPTINTQASNMSVECDGAGNTSSFSSWRSSHAGASASDQCSGVNWSDNYSAANWVADCGNTKHITVVFTATDACSNSSTTSAVFSIKDNTAPTINTQASNMSVECDGAGNTSSFSSWRSSHAGASASDQCSGVNWSDNYSAANWVA